MIEPHGGTLINRIAQGKEKEELIKQAQKFYKINIQYRFVSDCEMVAIGGFSPLKRRRKATQRIFSTRSGRSTSKMGK